MPFTFSHIGFVLPIKKKWTEKFSITGLIFGSLTPDLDILFRLTNVRSHLFQYNIQTILLIIFPMSLLFAFAFHVFCRNILIENLPNYFEKKYKKYKSFNFTTFFKENIFTVTYSIIFAIFLHLLLDSLCHRIDAYDFKMLVTFITNQEILINMSYTFGIYGLPVLFSIYGFYLIYKYEYQKKLKLKDFIINKEKIKFWISLCLVFIFVSIVKFFITQADTDFYIDYVIISLTSSFLVSVYASCILYYCIQKFKKI